MIFGIVNIIMQFLAFLDIHDKMETLAIFKVKKNVDKSKVERLWNKYQKDFVTNSRRLF